MTLKHLRVNYTLDRLLEEDAGSHPLVLFDRWLAQAIDAGIADPNAMTLATVSPCGQPSARIVLLKDVQDGRFIFFSNYESRKGKELSAQPRACLLFFWAPLERQVRIEGEVSRIEAPDSDAYFNTRPLESRISTWASMQSQVIANRQDLEASFDACQARFAQTPPARPAYWGGYALTPLSMEFWQGRASRLHDRLRYLRQGEGWHRERLAP
ncbi:MAG TPA: pyridoxamine 5'-phosphate oxidase [Burkholderiaceae bacterium]|nr:pyridoxamine 5'-phosphate oxidase [Burkholderiaceae bacterium]